MFDGLFCATLTGRRGGHTPFVQAGAETADTGAEAVEPDPGSSWEGHCGVVRPLHVPLMIGPLRRTYVVRKTDELLCGGYKWCLDLRRRAFAPDGQMSAECSRCPGSMALRPRDSVAPLR